MGDTGVRWAVVVAAVILLAVPLGGCVEIMRHPIAQGDSWPPPIGTCVWSDDGYDATVPCTQAHTQRLVAIVDGQGDRCPGETSIYETPADPGDRQLTACYQWDRQLSTTRR